VEVQWTYSGDTVELLVLTLPVPCILLLLRLYPPVLLTGMRVVQECFQTKKELVGHLIDSAQKNIPGHCGAIRRAIRTLSWLIYGVCEQTDQYYSFKSVTIFKR